MDKALYPIMISYFYVVNFFYQVIPIAPYTLTQSQALSDGQTLTSQAGKFELGFFSRPTNSRNRYLGIWYKTISVHTVVWVANRETPIPDTSGVLKIDRRGNIAVVNGGESVMWSSNSSEEVKNPIVELLESGNLVLRDATNTDPKSYIWQSFDYPGDTFLPGMKFGWNFRTGMNRYLSSWKSFDDPSRGDFTYGIELAGYPDTVMRKGPNKYFRLGPWNGIENTGKSDLLANPLYAFEVVSNAEELFFRIKLVNQSDLLRFTLVQTGGEGHLERVRWINSAWVKSLTFPTDMCDDYMRCGNYSICDTTKGTVCQCLKGFKPRSPKDWNLMDWSHGCERERVFNCSKGEGFRRYTMLKWPDTSNSWYNMNMTLEECRVRCVKNCSCQAYANAVIRRSGSGCVMWFTDLIDIKQLSSGGQDFYIRMPASDLESEANSRRKIEIITTVVAAIIAFSLASVYVCKKMSSRGHNEEDDLELHLYDLATIASATNNFSTENKLGQGGFGPVYKGILEGKEVAVKRLSKDSTQGMDAFKNEAMLIVKLQHKNLVKLLGCCIQNQEKVLVYEYMPNNSLDSSIFDATKRRLLDWKKRLEIIQGVAEGLLYLHRHSRLKIIHRDLKASNVLLDSEMLPKISDFGMARIFGEDQVEAKTKRVVGTYGYMSPEYVIEGRFSVKSDVFSFGVLVLEIISGKRNWGFRDSNHELNLLGHAWMLWREDRLLEVVDDLMSNSFVDRDIIRCIHIGLLCVQNDAEQRPTMSTVVMMLTSETAPLPTPQRPGFYMETSPSIVESSHRDKDPPNSNKLTISLEEGR